MKVVIYVSGGLVQSVIADAPGTKAMVVDYDSERIDPDRSELACEPVDCDAEYIEQTVHGIEKGGL